VFHVKHRAEELLEALGLDPSPTRIERLVGFEALLRQHAVPKGMVARSDAERLFDRHIADGLRAAPLLGEGPEALDLGSGAGLPGVPLAIVAEHLAWTLVEPRRQRAAFLELVQRELGLDNVTVLARNADEADRRVAVVTARAFGPPAATWVAAEGLLGPGGRVLVWVGAGFAADDAPEAPVVHLVTSPVAQMGPIAIMTRQ
jgi:16S rRNA (guanine527-N7)-methyltransferase